MIRISDLTVGPGRTAAGLGISRHPADDRISARCIPSPLRPCGYLHNSTRSKNSRPSRFDLGWHSRDKTRSPENPFSRNAFVASPFSRADIECPEFRQPMTAFSTHRQRCRNQRQLCNLINNGVQYAGSLELVKRTVSPVVAFALWYRPA